MSNYVVARNYAEALLEAARRHGSAESAEQYGVVLDTVAGIIATDPKVHSVMMSPRVTKAAKRDILTRGLTGVAPQPLLKFLAAVVQRGRQGMLRDISKAYQDLVDIKMNRVHAGVITAHPADEALSRDITSRLQEALGKTVVSHFNTDHNLIGGIIVRVGDRVFDGSLRRRLRLLRHRMLHAQGARSE